MKCKLLFLLFSCSLFLHAQFNGSELSWTLDSEVLLELENDSAYSYDIRQLFHVKSSDELFNSEFVYYPVNLGNDYLEDVKNLNDSLEENTIEKDDKPLTLWSNLHQTIGGGWVHFTNCLLYSLETENLVLTAPLMKRPETKWKPNPPTESYLRTKKWEYYVPVSQKNAIKEYKIRESQNELGDLKSIPQSFINLFLITSDRDIKKLTQAKNTHVLAKINLVKLLLGANYLGEAQISYISSTVLKSVKNYTQKKIPSVIIFDEYDAAVAMELSKDGYIVKKVVFREGASVTDEEAAQRTEIIKGVINKINEYNNKAFQTRLKSYYGS